MPQDDLTKEQRDGLVARARELESRLYPTTDGLPEVIGAERARLKESYYLALAEYFDRLPRVVMSVCPFTGKPLKRAFDPFGLDGPWWHKQRLVKIEEPAPPATFQVLLGALHLGGRPPKEVSAEVIPGPEVPFVVPRLLELPGMIAVIGELRLHTGDVAYPLAYFSEATIPPHQLHQHWLRQDLWFPLESGGTSWLIANDKWDFELAPWIRSGKVTWMQLGGGKAEIVRASMGAGCPYLGLRGDRQPQELVAGERELLDLPDGEAVNPFVE